MKNVENLISSNCNDNDNNRQTSYFGGKNKQLKSENQTSKQTKNNKNKQANKENNDFLYLFPGLHFNIFRYYMTQNNVTTAVQTARAELAFCCATSCLGRAVKGVKFRFHQKPLKIFS